MNVSSNSITPTPSSDYSAQITQFENGLLNFIASYGLPTEQVFVSVRERLKVFANVEGVVEKVEAEQLQSSIYIGVTH